MLAIKHRNNLLSFKMRKVRGREGAGENTRWKKEREKERNSISASRRRESARVYRRGREHVPNVPQVSLVSRAGVILNGTCSPYDSFHFTFKYRVRKNIRLPVML